jgi:hypothetical protein
MAKWWVGERRQKEEEADCKIATTITAEEITKQQLVSLQLGCWL